MNAFEFSKYTIELCSRYDFFQTIEILALDEPVTKIKVVINENIFINVFYNAEAIKYSFALIKNNKRIFGVDNARNWHIHPFENPDSHKEITGISLLDFMNMLKTNKEKWWQNK